LGLNLDFWEGKRVFLTGNTGFKGAWLGLWLGHLGARVTGYALAPDTKPSLFEVLGSSPALSSHIGDLGDEDRLESALHSADPEIVVHMAAQALVRASYRAPVETWITNVVGTARLLQAVRELPEVRAILVVTSDKVYRRGSTGRPFVESDQLGGPDPYSASKAAQEMVTASFAASYLKQAGVRVGSARAGNVVGGGDWATDRLVPDVVRALVSAQMIRLRAPHATRPWQFVLDSLAGYLEYARMLFIGADVQSSLNFGPTSPSATVLTVVSQLALHFGLDPHSCWSPDLGPEWAEQDALELDASAARESLNWNPRLDLDETLLWTADWYQAHIADDDMREFSLRQIERFMEKT
jgi:CDP-glucose 4,6-dehydratase